MDWISAMTDAAVLADKLSVDGTTVQLVITPGGIEAKARKVIGDRVAAHQFKLGWADMQRNLALLSYAVRRAVAHLSTPPMGFDEDHTVGESYGGRGSIKRSHRAEGRNWVD